MLSNVFGNSLLEFIQLAARERFVTLGCKCETDATKMAFLNAAQLYPFKEFTIEENDFNDGYVRLIELLEVEPKIVVLVTDNHPFKVEKWLKEKGIKNYFFSQFFSERYLFENNTSICKFYLDD